MQKTVSLENCAWKGRLGIKEGGGPDRVCAGFIICIGFLAGEKNLNFKHKGNMKCNELVEANYKALQFLT